MPFLRSLLILIGISAAATAPGLAPLGFDFSGPTSRFITPNGDGFNDSVFFRFSNPRDSTGTIRIYALRGRSVRSLSISVGDTFQSWDGRADGRAVESGIYIYVLSIENRTYSGAIVVIR